MTPKQLFNCLEARKDCTLRAMQGEQHNDFAKDYSQDELKGMLREINNTLNMLGATIRKG